MAGGFILSNRVTHSRFLPSESSHSFVYPTLSLLLDVDALENHRLDLGWIFAYCRRWRLTGIRPDPYLTPGSNSLREKLQRILQSEPEHIWMFTMPSYLGFEGINPLTVYFCYTNETLSHVVLEIHNTFGESHVHVLKPGIDEDTLENTGYDHQWTFPRQFHVSPFNDRSGFYSVAVRGPPNTLPAIRVQLYQDMETLKLIAITRAISSIPLTTFNLITALLRQPFDLLLSMPRISWQAAILHYHKRLDVWIRPEPYATPISGLGVRWQREGVLQAYAHRRVIHFLQAQHNVTLKPSDPSVPVSQAPHDESKSHLEITYSSPRFFSVIFLAPSADLAYRLGKAEGLFTVNDPELFRRVFSGTEKRNRDISVAQRLRCIPIPHSAVNVPRSHPLDSSFLDILVISLSILLDALEYWVFWLAQARPMSGTEPWLAWQRALK
ncbi:hypothetical protein C8J56DRAFT_457064 [Mycena floridula]|nr:hypothetical protein C8J56DRAFT_457064 [Mycena floridula]